MSAFAVTPLYAAEILTTVVAVTDCVAIENVPLV